MGTVLHGGIDYISGSPAFQNFAERTGTEEDVRRAHADNESFTLRCHTVAQVVSFDAPTQTVTVQPLLRESIVNNGNGQTAWVAISPLVNIPVIFPQYGPFIIAAEPQPGDEVLLLFADSQIDIWFQNGNLQNWNDRRRHDLSDAIAIFGINNQKQTLANTSGNQPITPNALEVRTKDGNAKFSLQKTTDEMPHYAVQASTPDGQFSVTHTQAELSFGSMSLVANSSGWTLNGGLVVNGNVLFNNDVTVDGTTTVANDFNIVNSVGTTEAYHTHTHRYVVPDVGTFSTNTAENPIGIPA